MSLRVHITTATNKYAAVDELLEVVVFCVWFVLKLYSEDPGLKAPRAVGKIQS